MDQKITILLATHNRAHLIEETLNSILAQTHENWECIIVDDFSSDKTKEVIASYVESDSRFLYFFKTHRYKKGLSGTRNQGLDIAEKRKAEFIQFFDDDDIMHPKKLELQLQPFLQDASLDLTICCYRKFEQNKTIEFDLKKADDKSCNIHTTNLHKSFFLNEINLNSPGPLWRATILQNYRFHEGLFYAEEREFYLRIFLNEKLKHKAVDKILFWYRKHPDAITSNLYDDKRKKSRSKELFRRVLLDETLRQENLPHYILKAFVVKALYSQDQEVMDKLILFIKKNDGFSKFRRVQLLAMLNIGRFFTSF